MNANESFEELASQFKRDTGLLAPGKDAPVAVGNDPAYGWEYRWREWDKWLKTRPVGLTPEEEANKQAYEEEMEDAQRDTAEGYRYV